MSQEIAKEQVGDFRFTFNGNMITELGEESISNPNVAIAELIKNAYDADGTEVFLEFIDPEKHDATIRISDDGKGMDLSDIKDRFMDIGSPHKKNINKTSEYKRVPVGAKGIGRFASHSLGHMLTLDTSVKGEKNGYELKFDWKRFTPADKATDIGIPTYKFNKTKSARGTTLEIRELKSSWNDDTKLKNLLKDLQLLVSPIDCPKKFKIKENISSKDTSVPKIKKDFFDKAAYSFKVRLTKKKELSYEFYKLGKRKKKDKLTLGENLSCGDAEFELFFYYKTPNSWHENTGAEIAKKNLDSIKSVLAEYGGIKLYRDHFRVKPYGDQSADWIGLDKWSRDASDIPGNTNVLGIVSITKAKNPNIEDTTTREGVINNAEYYDLEKFVTTSIREFAGLKNSLEHGRVKGRGKKGRGPKKIKVEKPKTGNGSAQAKYLPLIDIKGSFPSAHYNQIVHEANECNERNYPNGAFWLCRKIVENLVTHILEKKYKTQPDLWYDTTKARVLNLSQLIENLHNNRTDFTNPVVKNMIEVFNTDVATMRRAVNSTVHNNHDYLTDRADIKKYKVNKIIQTLIDIYSKT
jgi:hypothetical protein